MSDIRTGFDGSFIRSRTKYLLWSLAGIAIVTAGLLFPSQAYATTSFVLWGLLVVAPLVIPGILISAWVAASGAGGRIAHAFNGNIYRTIFTASVIGAITPVCGITVLPLMAGLLASGVPLAPIMAFWLSSPVTDPAMFSATAATLGWNFAIGKTLAAFGLGLFGGVVVCFVQKSSWAHSPLRETSFTAGLGNPACVNGRSFKANFWVDAERWETFSRETWSMVRLVLICLIPAFAAEHLLAQVLQPDALASYVGGDAWWAVPLSVFVGAPAYLDGYAALPLTRSLMEHGMSPAAAMSFLVSGGVVSIWGAMAIFPVLRVKPFMLFLALAVTGSMLAGWIYGALV